MGGGEGGKGGENGGELLGKTGDGEKKRHDDWFDFSFFVVVVVVIVGGGGGGGGGDWSRGRKRAPEEGKRKTKEKRGDWKITKKSLNLYEKTTQITFFWFFATRAPVSLLHFTELSLSPQQKNNRKKEKKQERST